MLRLAALLLPLLASLAFSAIPARAEPRTALVIGNAGYSYAPLANPAEDARAVAAALEASGFEVVLKLDADQAAMEAAIAGLGDRLRARGGIGFFYFSGHGVQIGGENYMVPVGQPPARESEVKYKAVNAAQVIDAMGETELNIVVLDACRNNPFPASTRAATRGLARVEGGSGLFVSFATSPGAVALDGEGRNSPYTKHLVAALETPDLTLEETFKRTLKGVHQETAGRQTPWISSSFFGDFVFRATGDRPQAPPASVAAAPAAAPPGADRPRQMAEALTSLGGLYRVEGTNSNGSAYRGMVAIAPEDAGYRFTWWIGQDVFKGRGRLAGRMLVVDWGDSHPVLYLPDARGALAGEWADGTASEDLTLVAPALSSPVPAGRYQVEGRNPDGSAYRGTVRVVPSGRSYRVEWSVGDSAYRGQGRLEHGLLTVDWGSSTPALYGADPDGRLVGLWNAGLGEERWSPLP